MASSCALCMVSQQQSTSRRRLYSPSSRHVLTTLTSIAAQHGVCASAIPADPGSGHVDQPYLCRQCFSEVEKVSKTRVQLLTLEEGVAKKSVCRAAVDGTPRTSTEPRTEGRQDTPQKRVSEPIETPPAKRPRQSMVTPIRQLLQQPVVQDSPSVSIVVKRKTRSTVHPLTQSLKRIGRSVGRRNPGAIARQVMAHSRVKRAVLNITSRNIRKELATMCKQSNPSVLRGASSEEMNTFNWDSLICELKVKAPTLLHILQGSVQTKRRKTSTKGKSYRVPDKTTVGLCSAILLRHKSQRMNLVQRIISMILYSGHTNKQVFNRLQRLQMCLSHQRTIATVEKLCKGHDSTVHSWRDRLEHNLSGFCAGGSADVQGTETTAASEESHIPDTDFGITAQEVELLCSQSSSSSFECPNFSPVSTLSSVSTLSPISTVSIPSSPCSSTSSGTRADSLSDASLPIQALPTFKLVGDNIDKYVKPREMRIDAQAASLHYFNLYTVRDRLDLSATSDEAALPDIKAVKVESVLPDCAAETSIMHNFTILVGRVLRKRMPFFATFAADLEEHITHVHYKEMCQKSEVVPLGIIPKCENKHEDMISILETLHKYVPTLTTTERIDVSDSETLEVPVDKFHYLLFGGDFLTAKRARGGQNIRSNSERGKDRLEGLMPVVEDWHGKVCLLIVIWKRLYSASSRKDCGTLYQLRNLINRRNVVSDPKNSVTACEDFFLLVVEAHILAACMEVFGMSSLNDTPSAEYFSEDAILSDPSSRRVIFLDAIQGVLDRFVSISFTGSSLPQDVDHVLAYAKEVISLGLLFMEFVDGIREGDGLRILRCWRFFLPLFKASDRRNYSIEAFNLLAQHDFLFSPRMQQQLLWSRTINTQGKPGKNIPCDLHMEHINRECKTAIGHVGANICNDSVCRVGKCIGELSKVTKQFDTENSVSKDSGKHSMRSSFTDLGKVLFQLQESSILQERRGRKHARYPKFQCNMTRQLNKEELNQWMEKKLKKIAINL